MERQALHWWESTASTLASSRARRSTVRRRGLPQSGQSHLSISHAQWGKGGSFLQIVKNEALSFDEISTIGQGIVAVVAVISNF